MDKEKLERVDGISRPEESMWIERDKNGIIKQVYDLNYNPIEKHMLYRCFTIDTVDNGFFYKGEFIELEDAYSYARKRKQGLQRRNYGHTKDQVL